ncbi:MAG: hypothetical protein ACYS21_19545 [Planctomycetota bacterium]|jgi:hypothetical protein
MKNDQNIFIRVGTLAVSFYLIISTVFSMRSAYSDKNPFVRPILWGDVEAMQKLIVEGQDVNAHIGRQTVLTYTDKFLHNREWHLLDLEQNEFLKKETKKMRLMQSIVKVLLDNGANINHIDENGMAIIHYVSKNSLPVECMVELLGFLIEEGADPELEDKKGRTPSQLIGEYFYNDEERKQIQDFLKKD